MSRALRPGWSGFVVLRQHDGAGAGTERRLTVDEVAEALEDVLAEQLEKCRGFPSGND